MIFHWFALVLFSISASAFQGPLTHSEFKELTPKNQQRYLRGMVDMAIELETIEKKAMGQKTAHIWEVLLGDDAVAVEGSEGLFACTSFYDPLGDNCVQMYERQAEVTTPSCGDNKPALMFSKTYQCPVPPGFYPKDPKAYANPADRIATSPSDSSAPPSRKIDVAPKAKCSQNGCFDEKGNRVDPETLQPQSGLPQSEKPDGSEKKADTPDAEKLPTPLECKPAQCKSCEHLKANSRSRRQCEGQQNLKKKFMGTGEKTCVNGAMTADFDYTAKTCKGVREVNMGGQNYTCDQSQTLCNPMIFGAAEDGKGLCVPVKRITTRACRDKVDGLRKKNQWKDVQKDIKPEEWNKWVEGIRSLCESNSASAEYHCTECAVISKHVSSLAKLHPRYEGLCGVAPAEASTKDATKKKGTR